MPCNTYLEWLDTPASASGSLPENIARHISTCAECRQAHAEIQALRTHCARMSPDTNEAVRLWESLAPLIPAQPATPPKQTAGNPQPAGSASSAVKASAAVSAPVGIGPVVILAAGAVLIGVIEYGLTAMRSQPPTPPAVESSRTGTPEPADVSSAPPSLQRPVPAEKASGTLPEPIKQRPGGVSIPTPRFVSPPESAVRPPVIPDKPAEHATSLPVPQTETSTASGGGDELIDGFVPMTAPSGGQD